MKAHAFFREIRRHRACFSGNRYHVQSARVARGLQPGASGMQHPIIKITYRQQ